jgi:hypothetical protein
VDADKYFAETEPATRHMFAALQEYDSVTPPPSLGAHADPSGVIRLNRSQAEEYMRDLTLSLGLEVAKATLCGSIAQVAYMAINQFSQKVAVDPECAALSVTAGSKAAKFCLGRRVHGIPLGLLVYAARVQYNHWDEGMPSNPVPRAVFDALYRHYANDLSFDLAYVLDWPAPRPVAHYVIRHELRWMAYNDYISDMRQALVQSAA